MAIYEKSLSEDLSRQGNIFTSKDEKPSSRQLIRTFCIEKGEVTVDQLLKYALEVGLSRDSVHYNAFNAAHKVMVRVSKDLFVRDDLVKFDVEGIDSALNSFVQGKIISLRDVNDFSMFPSVKGYSWNLYMLESFLRKYSRRYTFDTTATNNSLLGAIYPNSMRFEDYLEVQAQVILQENIPIDEDSIVKFLIDRGFRKTKNKVAITEIVERVQEILYL